MARKKRPTNEVDQVSNSPEVRTTRGLKPKSDKEGVAMLRGRIETLVGDQRIKRMAYRQELATDKLITDGKGGKDLEQFALDYSQDYKYSAKDKKLRKPVNDPINKNPSNVLLRQVSEMEEYK